MSVKVVNQTDLGVYVATTFGIPIDDNDGHVLAIAAKKGDKKRIETLIKTAKALGYEEVGFVFLAGHRPVSDEEHYIQQERMKAGLTPDPYDIGESIDAYWEAQRKK